MQEFFSRFGYPFAIFTDQGRNFESRLFKELCRVLTIHKAKTSIGQVERYNRTLEGAHRADRADRFASVMEIGIEGARRKRYMCFARLKYFLIVHVLSSFRRTLQLLITNGLLYNDTRHHLYETWTLHH